MPRTATLDVQVFKMSISNLNTGETFRAQFNPEKLEESLESTYAEIDVPGLSHKPMQFSNTSNEEFTTELFWRATKPAELEAMRQARRFLKSLCFPRRDADTVAGGAPPRVLFVWPRMLSLVCAVKSVKFSHELFTSLGQARVSRATLTLSEIRDVRLSSEDVRDDTELRYGHVPRGDIPATRPSPFGREGGR